MNRILINGRFLTQPITGVQRYARELCSALDDLAPAELRFQIVRPKGASSLGRLEEIEDSSRLKGIMWEQIRLPYWMKTTKADLLWSPANSGPRTVSQQIVTLHDASVT